MKLTKKHIALYEMVNERGVGRNCNDLNPEEIKILNQSEWKEFYTAYHHWNDPAEFVDERRSNYYMMDFMVIGFIQHLLIDSYIKNEGL